MKCTARAYAIQGLVKYHGLRNPKLRIPYHDSISVCMKSLDTVTTVETGNSLRRDSILINGTVPTTGEEARVRVVIDKLRELAGEKTQLRVSPEQVVKALTMAHSLRPERYTILGETGVTEGAAEKVARATGVIG